ncbi:MAG TPA: alpha-N-arabinofuranosidase [Terriglobia bacterium]|nr:alpha-N-arabinofuranosidase [Terriglobia bacterium]
MRTNSLMKLGLMAAFVVPGLVYAQTAAAPSSAPIVAAIDTTKVSEPVSKYEYGMFIEHIGPLIYRSLWSEMLDDRKFYFPITSKEAAARGPARGPRAVMPQRWRPVGPDEVVVMDKDHPFVGDQSPRIELDASAPQGIKQSGFALVKGKKYTGRVYLRGAAGSKVKVSLIWGAGASGRQTVSFATLSQVYKKFPLTFTSQADTADGALEIVGTGRGNFHIGTVSLMPVDNVQGFRPDTIALLRQLHSGFWRLPGGNFLSDWSWYDSVGDIDKRPPMFDHAWNAMQTNDVGMDEFMTLCKLIGVEPYITVNAGFGDAHSAAEEVEYINGSVHTRLGAMRARNGHPEPYHVRFWNIGNEPWGTFQLGHTDLKYYVLKHNEFAKAMRKVDPSITLIASGQMLEDMNLNGQMRAKYVGNLKPLFGTDLDWTGGLLAHCWGNFDGIAEHWYAQPGRHFDLERAKSLPPDAPTDNAYVKVDQTPLEWARFAANVVHRKAEEWEGYQQRFPAMLDKKTFLSIDEYAYFGGGFNRGVNLQLALAYGMVFNEMLRHTDFLTMSAHTMGVSTLDYNRTASTFNTTGLLFKLYGEHFVGSIPVALSGNSPQPAPQYPIGGDQPKTNSGSPTYPLDMFAALTPDRKYLTLAVVNSTESEQKFNLDVTGARIQGPSTLWLMTGKDLEATDRVGQAPQVEVKRIAISDAPHSLTVAPISINIFRIPLAGGAQ